LRALGVRFILTDAETVDKPAILRRSLAVRGALGVNLFELENVNLGTYSPTRFVKAATADAIVKQMRENKSRLDQVAVVPDDIPATTAQARNVVMTIERDGVRIQAASDGPAHILVPDPVLPLPRRRQRRCCTPKPRQSFPDPIVVRRDSRRPDRISLRALCRQQMSNS
jgi:hypothetical protein